MVAAFSEQLDPADPVAAFEEISVKVKQHTVTPATYKEFSREVTPAAKAALAKSIQKTSSLIKVPCLLWRSCKIEKVF